MSHSTTKKVIIAVVAIFVLTMIAYPLVFSPQNLQTDTDPQAVDIEPPGNVDVEPHQELDSSDSFNHNPGDEN